jgi:hypothetical protein
MLDMVPFTSFRVTGDGSYPFSTIRFNTSFA